MSQLLTRVGFAVAGGVAGVLVVQGAMPFFEEPDPQKLVSNTVVYSPLDEGESPASGLEARVRADRHQRIAVRTQPHYRGELYPEAIRKLTESGSAESLEHRLRDAYKKKLQQHLGEFERNFRELSLLVAVEGKEVKRKLRSRPERCIVIRSLPRERDPAYPEVLKAREEIENRGLGTVWGEALELGKSEVHFVILWKEWPALKRLHKEQALMVQERQRLVRAWIRSMYDKQGMNLFSGY
ncbi:MAG: hypothetical protein ACE5F1_12495 [Planctomycetota bacterium]